MQTRKTRTSARNLYAATRERAVTVLSTSSAALGSPQDDPSRLPLTPRGHATPKVSHPSNDRNNNFSYMNDHVQ